MSSQSMDRSCDALQEYNREDYRKEDEECGETVPDVSREEGRDDSHGSDDQHIEGLVKCDAFLRAHDSEDEESDSDDKTESHSKEEEVHGLSDRQNLNVKTVSKSTPVVSSNSTGDSLSKTRNNNSFKSETIKQKEYKKPKTSHLSNKWGETVGITDTEGRAKRVVNMCELKNFVPLRMRYNSAFKYYFALIDQRYPQVFRTYPTGAQRWRMRYNIFVDGVFDALKKLDSILHIGEIMIYCDISEDTSTPVYVNSSFYGNYTPLERTVDTSRLTRMIVRLHDILTSSLMLQLKFPVDEKAFKQTDGLFYKFLLRQKDLMDEQRYVSRRTNQWFPMRNRFTIQTKRSILGLKDDYQSRPIDNRRRDRIYRPSTQRRNTEKVDASDGDFNASKSYRFKDNKSRRSEQRSDRRSQDMYDTRVLYRRSDELRDKTSNSEAVDRNASKGLFKKSFQRKDRSVDRMDEAFGLDSRASGESRVGRNAEHRSRPKTLRR